MKSVSFCLNLLKNKKIYRNFESRGHILNVHFFKEEIECNSLKYSTSSKGHRLYAFGLTEHGGLGLKKENSILRRYIARPVQHRFAEENTVTDVSCGFGFTAIAVSSNDTCKLYGCGINTDKQITGEDDDLIHCPKPISIGIENSETNIVSLSAGRAHLAVVTDQEGVFLLGSNCYGQCGRAINNEEKCNGAFVINCIKDLDCACVAHVYCGQDHTLFLTSEGGVYSCGWGVDGQTGQGHTQNVCIPTKVKGDIEGETIVKLAGRSDTVLALNSRGEVFGWGSSEYLQLSPSKEIQQLNSPCHLKHLSNLGKIVDISAGGTSCMVLTESGDVYIWGYGILGTCPEIQKTNIPFLIPRTLFGCNEAAPGVTVVSIASGLTYMTAINSCSHMYSWGHNKHGCLGIGHIRDQYFPYKVAICDLAVKASCGLDHTMVLCKPLG